MATYNLIQESLQEHFAKSRAKVQIYGGGFANGKTSASVVLKILEVARNYPGCNILAARSTYPKLNDTLRKEFIKWCPKHWIQSFPQSANSSNTCTLTNGSTINFRYVAQTGKGTGQSTSNLLSATYDLIVVDQIEDPEISRKDFDDLFGRLRGTAPYIGNDCSMPETGPRWFIVTCNPTRNWFYKTVVKPYHQWLQDGRYHEGLLCETDENGQPLEDEDGKVTPIMDLIEGSTYDNKENLPADFIKTLEATYHGEMRTRFLMGEWGGFEGLIYTDYDPEIHTTTQSRILAYLINLRTQGYQIHWLEGYDYGIASPACYLLAFIDPTGKVIICDGFYRAESSPEEQTESIRACRSRFILPEDITPSRIWADPSIFRRTGGTFKTVGQSVADIFYNNGQGLRFQRGNNDIIAGIVKIQGYLHSDPTMIHPFNDYVSGSPRLIFAEELEFIDVEISDYYWDKDKNNEPLDKPRDGHDHAMDCIRYLLSSRPDVSKIIPQFRQSIPSYMQWQTMPDQAVNPRAHRYG